jgi:Fe-Mn family superoxide dismutase
MKRDFGWAPSTDLRMGGRGGEPCGALAAAITQDFGDLATFRTRFNAAANGVFGSGWAFVTVTREGRLAIVTRPNQDNPLFDGQRVLMGNHVWEHAYYLRYQNRRAEYSTNWWNVLDWAKIGARYDAAGAGTLMVYQPVGFTRHRGCCTLPAWRPSFRIAVTRPSCCRLI